MATVVVCDGDGAVRAAVSAACGELGLDLVAETDACADAIELVRRFDVDILVLDLSLGDGAGERTLRVLRDDGSKVRSVIFTAYAPDPLALRGLGAREVVDNHDYARLGHVLSYLRDIADRDTSQTERRVASHAVIDVPSRWRSPAGVAAHRDMAGVLETLEAGDAVLAVTLAGLDSLEADVGPLLVADCRLAMAGALRDELRVQDLLHEDPTIHGFIALLRGGDERAVGSVWARLQAEVHTQALPGDLRAAASRVDAMGAPDAVARAVGALQSAGPDTPSFQSV